MDTKFNFEDNRSNIVYVRPIDVGDLPKDVQAQVQGAEKLYAVHRTDGEPVAVVSDRLTAFELARDNDLLPVSVH